MNKWIGIMKENKATVYLGTFAEEAEAAVAFDKAVLMLRGKDAEINFPLSNYLDRDGNIIEDQEIKDRIEGKRWEQSELVTLVDGQSLFRVTKHVWVLAQATSTDLWLQGSVVDQGQRQVAC